MTEMGIPDNFQKENPFQKIGLRRKAPSASSTNEVAKGELLNKLSGAREGIESGIKYVDAKKHNKMGKDEFMKLLAVQMQNQDPLNPMDQNKFSAELAQYSQLEQLTNINSAIGNMNKNEMPQSKFYAASFLGKEVITNGASIDIKEEGKASDVSFKLSDNAQKVMIRIFDKNNQMIQQLELDGMAKGTNTVSWNGKRLDGQLAAEGVYSVNVSAWGNDLAPIEAKTKSQGIVAGVHFENNQTVLTLTNGQKVSLRDVDSFRLPNELDSMNQKNLSKLNEQSGNLKNTISKMANNQIENFNKNNSNNKITQKMNLVDKFK